jgi:hypothetical protein
VALSNNRLLDLTDGQVGFRYKAYRHDAQPKTMTLAAAECIRRFLLHVLPPGFQRIRSYGLLGNRYRKEKLTRCRQLLGMLPCPAPVEATPSALPGALRSPHGGAAAAVSGLSSGLHARHRDFAPKLRPSGGDHG